jgi:hypothetical protein
MTRFGTSRFEFIFTSLVKSSPRIFTTVQAVFRYEAMKREVADCIATFMGDFHCRAYETSKMYRDLKLRGAVVKDKHIILLPNEKIYNKVSKNPQAMPRQSYTPVHCRSMECGTCPLTKATWEFSLSQILGWSGMLRLPKISMFPSRTYKWCVLLLLSRFLRTSPAPDSPTGLLS